MAKIAIHQPRASYIIGGAEAVSIEMTKVLSLKHEVSFITSKAKYTENFNSFYVSYKDKINFIFIESPLVFEFKDNKNLNAFDFESIAFGENSSVFYDNNKFDVIVSHYCTDLITLNKRDASIILHLHGYPKEKRFINDISYRKADVLIGCSEFALKKTLEYFPDIKETYYFHMRPDLDDFYSSNVKKDLDILFIGRLIERKGVKVLISSLKKIENNFNNCIIAGSGPIENEIKKLICELKLENKIKVIGSIGRTRVIELMNQARIFIHPTTSREPFPTTLLEAMSVGTPVISTFVGGISEIIIDNVNGILVEPNNEIALGKTITTLLKDKKLHQRIKSAGLNKINNNFNKDEKSSEFLILYDKILGKRK